MTLEPHSPKPDTSARTGPATAARSCARCGASMEERKCKVVCGNCGAYDDCTDP